MKVHHLNLCTMCPFGGRHVSGGQGSLLAHAELIIHALLVETAHDGLVLVDTGCGLEDVKHPIRRLGAPFNLFGRPQLKEEMTAIRQVERLGFSRRDVRHIVVTHLDVDHAGGIPDFPEAQIHVHKREHRAAMDRLTANEKHRYRPVHFQGSPNWSLHDDAGDNWYGFEALRVIAEDILLIPLPGHTRGHSAVAVRASEPGGPSWLLHCGDAYFFHLEKEDPECCPPLLQTFQKIIAVDDSARRKNAQRLRELHREHGRRVRIFCAHDPTEYKTLS